MNEKPPPLAFYGIVNSTIHPVGVARVLGYRETRVVFHTPCSPSRPPLPPAAAAGRGPGRPAGHNTQKTKVKSPRGARRGSPAAPTSRAPTPERRKCLRAVREFAERA